MYIIEGNVGAGKSTLLNMIQRTMHHVHIVQEPVTTWAQEDLGSESLLAKFYKDVPRWAYTMETYTMFSRVKEHIRVQNLPNPFIIMERSLYSGHYCFARNGYEQGYMKDLEWSIYNHWFTYLVPHHCKVPQGFIYLSSNPTLCFERTTKRNRTGEETIPLIYFEQIHTKHEQFLVKKQGIIDELKKVPVLILDGTTDFEHDLETQKEFTEKIEEFLLITTSSSSASKAQFFIK